LPTLVAHHAASGFGVAVTTDGTPIALDGPTDLAAYRILQEALTNAARHGTGAAHVQLRFSADALELVVTNPAEQTDLASGTCGHGLIGMTERAHLLGGTLETACTDGVFRLTARLPLSARQS
jgi:signal transduction histidine kinase